MALRYQNDLAGAEGFLKKQISLSPDNSGLYVLLGDILVRGQKDEEALLAFEKAQELNPENMQPYVNAGRLLVAMGRKDEAMAKYQAMVKKQPDSIVGLMGIATLLEAEGAKMRKRWSSIKRFWPSRAITRRLQIIWPGRLPHLLMVILARR